MPERRLSFNLPQDPEKVAEIIRMIPDSWRSINGALRARSRDRRMNRVAPNTSLTFDSVYGCRFEPVETGRKRKSGGNERIVPPCIADVVLGQKMPSNILFEDAGHNQRNTIPWNTLIGMAAKAITRGYYGSFVVVEQYHRNVLTQHRHSLIGADTGTARAAIHLTWNEQYGGSYNSIACLERIVLQRGAKYVQPATENISERKKSEP